jgi:hypothetical protein
VALCREAGIAGQSISAGLGALRKANYAATGLYSHAFFSLSIGFERVLKLLYIIDYGITHSRAIPSEDILRNTFGHDLEKLFQFSRTLYSKSTRDWPEFNLPVGGIEDKIVIFLSEFAKATRYYNLAYLTGGRTASNFGDPVSTWFTSIGSDIMARHYRPARQARDAAVAAFIGEQIGRYAMVMHTAEDGTPLSDVESASLQTGKNRILQKYGTFYCAKISRYLYMLLFDLVHDAHKSRVAIPYLYEFFFPFMNDDRYLLSRLTFPPRGQ